MDREWLAAQLEAGRSYESIARELGRSPSTVSLWARKHGLRSAHTARHAARGALDAALLANLVREGWSIRDVAAHLGCSTATVRHWLDRHGLRTDPAVVREARERANEGIDGPRRHCPTHGLTHHIRRASGWRCSRCSADHVTIRRQRIKRTLVAEAGGACAICGYDRCTRALEFHHVDPRTKRFAIGRQSAALSLEQVRAEAAKCVLLCGNCHAEVEDGLVDLPV